ncbi:MAG: lipid IV(A) 3-deoxy-D-manno-octulosonic acid transferase [Colwellia sp.]|nr:lipid IV(A) 3-deoxy-D-manno-octulosonic acid transferase [Colwellia sp.]
MKYFLSLLLYRILTFLLLPFLLLALLIRSKNSPQYRQRLFERLGFLPRSLRKNGIVVHAASVGEVIALKNFIDKLIITYTDLPITITTFTPTGSAQVKKLFQDKVQHCYLPIDSIFCSWLFLHKLQPKTMVFMETELWPNLIAQCAQKKIKLLLVNGRLSISSVRSYKKFNWLFTATIRHFDQILTQSNIDREHFLKLGAKTQQCHSSGNLKFDISVNESVLTKQAELESFVQGKRQIWVVASTHQGDEKIILSSFKQLLDENPELLLVIVPRHPERFDDVAQLCLTQGFTMSRRSDKTTVNPRTKIWLLDTLGELLPTCALATVVTMGGSFSNITGHNPLEPALFKKPIVVGADMSSFLEVMQQLVNAKGIVQLPNNQNIEEQLYINIKKILQDEQLQLTLGNNAYQVVQENQGASDHSILTLQKLMNA